MKYTILFLILVASALVFMPKTGFSSDNSLTYTKDIQPIFKNRCSVCHDYMTTEKNWMVYENAFAKSKEIKTRVFIERTMPAAGMPIDESERKKIADWVDQGAKK